MSNTRNINAVGIWPKSLTVDKRIISTLSRSTYNNFPQALKELIVNSYDADATRVNIEVNESQEYITIKDDGKGMSEKDFSFYLRIAGKSRKKDDFTDKGRRIVGKFGVGFLAVFPFCYTYKIETSKLGSTSVVHATIDCEKYFKHSEGGDDIESVPIFGGIREGESTPSESFTKISLLGFTDELKSFFNEEYKTNQKISISKYSPVELVKWTLCEYLPIRYERDELNKIFKLNDGLPFDVYLDQKKIYRNSHANRILQIHEGDFQKIGKIKFRYVVGTQMRPIRPAEARYILVRNHNVGVGERTTYGIGLDGRLYAKLAWISVDVDVIEGLNDLISVTRDKFNFSPEYEKFKDFFRGVLRHWAEVINEITEYQKLVDNESSSKISHFDNETDKKKERIETTLKNKGIEVVVDEINDSFLEEGAQKKSKILIEERSISQDRQKNSIAENLRKVSIISPSKNDIKTIVISGDQFELRFDHWISNSLNPICRLKEDVLFVNQGHNLLKNKNDRDIFIKVFAIIAINYERGNLDRSTAVLLNNNLIQTLST